MVVSDFEPDKSLVPLKAFSGDAVTIDEVLEDAMEAFNETYRLVVIPSTSAELHAKHFAGSRDKVAGEVLGVVDHEVARGATASDDVGD